MSIAGWIIMLVSVFGMTAFFIWCLWRVLSTPEAVEYVHGTTDIDPGDADR